MWHTVFMFLFYLFLFIFFCGGGGVVGGKGGGGEGGILWQDKATLQSDPQVLGHSVRGKSFIAIWCTVVGPVCEGKKLHYNLMHSCWASLWEEEATLQSDAQLLGQSVRRRSYITIWCTVVGPVCDRKKLHYNLIHRCWASLWEEATLQSDPQVLGQSVRRRSYIIIWYTVVGPVCERKTLHCNLMHSCWTSLWEKEATLQSDAQLLGQSVRGRNYITIWCTVVGPVCEKKKLHYNLMHSCWASLWQKEATLQSDPQLLGQSVRRRSYIIIWCTVVGPVCEREKLHYSMTYSHYSIRKSDAQFWSILWKDKHSI